MKMRIISHILVLMAIFIVIISPLQATKYKAEWNSLKTSLVLNSSLTRSSVSIFTGSSILFLRTRQSGTPTISKSRDMRAMSTI